MYLVLINDGDQGCTSFCTVSSGAAGLLMQTAAARRSGHLPILYILYTLSPRSVFRVIITFSCYGPLRQELKSSPVVGRHDPGKCLGHTRNFRLGSVIIH